MADELDPAHVDIVAQPRRRRRRARVPQNLRPLLEKAEQNLKQLPSAPGIMLHPVKGDFDAHRYGSPYVDHDAWEIMIASAFSTRSVSTYQTFVAQIIGFCRKEWSSALQQWVRDEAELNQCLNIVNGVKPRNEAEAALAVQMCSVHLMQVRMSERILSNGWVNPQDAAIAAKLARTYAQLLETLDRRRGKVKTTKQKIVVKRESHVHHHQHVHIDGGGSNFDYQSHGDGRHRTGSENPMAAVEPAQRAALPSPESLGESLRPCGCEGQAGLRQSRRSGGRAKGKGERQLSARGDDG